MAKLDNYMIRKAQALQERQMDWTVNPDKAVVSIKASSKVAGITGARPTRMGDHVIISDSAPGLAGHALGPTSPEMLLGALASCLLHTYLIEAAMKQIPIDHVEVEVSGTLDYKGVVGLPVDLPPALRDIRYTAHLECSASAETIDQMHLAVEMNCPVLNTLRLPTVVQRIE